MLGRIERKVRRFEGKESLTQASWDPLEICGTLSVEVQVVCSVGFLQRESDGEKDGKDNEALRKSSDTQGWDDEL